MKTFKQYLKEQKLQRHEYIAKLAQQHANLSLDHDQLNPHFHKEKWNQQTQNPESMSKEESTSYARHRTISDIADFDPDKKSNSNTQWMLRQYGKGHYKHEDLPRVSAQIEYFHSIKPRLPNTERDLNQYTLNPAKEPKKKSLISAINSQKEIDKEYPEGQHFSHPQAVEVPGEYDRSKLRVFHLTSHAAARGFRDSCGHTDNTGGWCTGWKDSEHYHNYNEKGPIYGVESREIHPDTGHAEWRKYQIHFPTHSLMNMHDQSVEPEEMVEKNPELKNVRWNFKDKEGNHPEVQIFAPFLSERGLKHHIEHSFETGNHNDVDYHLSVNPEKITSSHIHSLLDAYPHNQDIDPHTITNRVFRLPAANQEHIDRFWDMQKADHHSYFTRPNIFNRHAEESFGDMAQRTSNPEHLKWFYAHSRDVRSYGPKFIAGARLKNEFGITPETNKPKTSKQHADLASDHELWAKESERIPSNKLRDTMTKFHKEMSEYHKKKSEEQ